MIRAALISSLLLGACAQVPGSGAADRSTPEYKGVETSLLNGDLVRFNVAMSGARSEAE